MAGAGEIRAGRAFVELLLKDGAFQKGMRKAAERLKGFADNANKIGTKLATIGGIMTAPLVAAVKFASDAEETFSKFNVVFDTNAAEMKAWSDQFAKSVGRSKTEVAGFLASTQDLFVPLGFAADKAEELSKEVTKLTVDLASFNNKADADVMRDLQAALTGSGETMKKYGVIVDEAAVKQELLNTNIDPKTATNAEKVYARLSIILRGTTAAQGDAIRTADSFANQMKRLRAEVENTAVEIGQALIPVLAPLVKELASGVQQFAEWARQNKDLIVRFAELGAGILAAAGALKILGGAVSAIELASRAAALANPWVLLAAEIAAVVVIAKELLDTLNQIDELNRGGGDMGAAQRGVAAASERAAGPEGRAEARRQREQVAAEDAALAAKLQKEAAEKQVQAAKTQEEINREMERIWTQDRDPTNEQRIAAEAQRLAREQANAENVAAVLAEGMAAVNEQQRQALEAQIAGIEGLIDDARDTSFAGAAQQGSQEFAQAIAQWMAPRQDRQISLLQRQLEAAKDQLRKLEAIAKGVKEIPQVGVVQL